MAEYTYSAQPANVGPFLDKVRSMGRPDKLTIKVIESLSFKSKNDRALLAVMKAVGLVDQSGVPTPRWNQFRSKQDGGAALAAGIREHYSALFALYPDAYQKDNEALHSFFSSNTSVGEGALKHMINTFKALCSKADFQGDLPMPDQFTPPGQDTPVVAGAQFRSGIAPYTVNVNIQLTLPENSDEKTFNEFFKSMKKHLLSDHGPESS